MADYQQLPGDPVILDEKLLERKILNIRIKDYLLFLTSVIVITVLNIIFREYLFQVSLNLIMQIQEDGRNPYVLEFFQTVRKFGSSYFIYGVLVLIYVFKERALAFHYTLIISMFMFFLVFMKMIIRFPRPYQYSSDIIPVSCSGQWGCPSGTSMRSTTMLFSIYLDFVHSQRRKMGVLQYLLLTVLAMGCITSVMVSRVYLAAHSINQVIFGATIGIEISLFMHYTHHQVYEHLKTLSSQPPRHTNYKPYLVIATIIFTISQAIPFLSYLYVSTSTTIPQMYIDNLVALCPPDAYVKVFHDRAFPYIGKPALGYCAYLGILIHHKYLTSNSTNQDTESWRSLLRLLITGLICWLFVWQLNLVDWSQNIILLYFNKTVIPCGCTAFLLCSFTETLFEHMGLLNRDYQHKYCVFIHEVNENESGNKYVMRPYKALGGGADYRGGPSERSESLLPTQQTFKSRSSKH